MPADKKLSSVVRCGHCSNSAPMEVVGSHSQPDQYREETVGLDGRTYYELLVCPVCDKVNLHSTYWADWMDPTEALPKVLYPQSEKMPSALPSQVMTAYQAALRVRSIDPNAYAVLLGRVLEKIGQDRNAQGDSLYRQFEDLANRGEIPRPLVEMAHSLRQLRNVGAHAGLGELTDDEIPFLDDLCRAVLEYVYSGPDLIQKAKERYEEIKRGGIR